MIGVRADPPWGLIGQVGALKLQDMKLQDMKMMDQLATGSVQMYVSYIYKDVKNRCSEN